MRLRTEILVLRWYSDHANPGLRSGVGYWTLMKWVNGTSGAEGVVGGKRVEGSNNPSESAMERKGISWQ